MAHDEAHKSNPAGTIFVSSTETLVGTNKKDVVKSSFKVLKLYILKLNEKLELFF